MKYIWMLLAMSVFGADTVTHPYPNIKLTYHPMTSPRTINSWIAEVNLDATTAIYTLPSGGTWHTIKGFHEQYMTNNGDVLAVAAGFYNFVDANTNAEIAGFTANQGSVVSTFCTQPPPTIAGQTFPNQSYAIVDNAVAVNFDPNNHASIVHVGATSNTVAEAVTVWTAVSGSFQTISNGVDCVSLIDYSGPPNLTVNGTYNNGNRWYNVVTARTALAINQAGNKLYLVVADNVSGSSGMTVPEMVNNILLDATLFPDPTNRPYNAINTDGGGSTTMTLWDPFVGPEVVNNTTPRTDGSMLIIDYIPLPYPSQTFGSVKMVGSATLK